MKTWTSLAALPSSDRWKKTVYASEVGISLDMSPPQTLYFRDGEHSMLRLDLAGHWRAGDETVKLLYQNGEHFLSLEVVP